MMDLDVGVIQVSNSNRARGSGEWTKIELTFSQDVEKRQKKRLLLDYLSDNLKHHNWWAYRYFFCEFLALINVIGTVQIMIRRALSNTILTRSNVLNGQIL